MTITPAEYIKAPVCPVCGQSPVEYAESLEIEGEQAWQWADCSNCDTRFGDLYHIEPIGYCIQLEDGTPDDHVIYNDPQQPHMDDNERDTILAALRALQSATDGPPYSRSELDELATNGGAHDAMTIEEIDDLCERLNQDVTEPTIAADATHAGE